MLQLVSLEIALTVSPPLPMTDPHAAAGSSTLTCRMEAGVLCESDVVKGRACAGGGQGTKSPVPAPCTAAPA